MKHMTDLLVALLESAKHYLVFLGTFIEGKFWKTLEILSKLCDL
jgi:hypothetical protein